MTMLGGRVCRGYRRYPTGLLAPLHPPQRVRGRCHDGLCRLPLVRHLPVGEDEENVVLRRCGGRPCVSRRAAAVVSPRSPVTGTCVLPWVFGRTYLPRLLDDLDGAADERGERGGPGHDDVAGGLGVAGEDLVGALAGQAAVERENGAVGGVRVAETEGGDDAVVVEFGERFRDDGDGGLGTGEPTGSTGWEGCGGRDPAATHLVRVHDEAAGVDVVQGPAVERLLAGPGVGLCEVHAHD